MMQIELKKWHYEAMNFLRKDCPKPLCTFYQFFGFLSRRGFELCATK